MRATGRQSPRLMRLPQIDRIPARCPAPEVAQRYVPQRWREQLMGRFDIRDRKYYRVGRVPSRPRRVVTEAFLDDDSKDTHLASPVSARCRDASRWRIDWTGRPAVVRRGGTGADHARSGSV